jgi:trimethylamine-N-oxide reductase (cytochrome c)
VPLFIKEGDIIKVFNERGVVLCGARVWERMMPGVVYVDHGARHDPLIDNVDRGGAIKKKEDQPF